jgi:hypothetical protein
MPIFIGISPDEYESQPCHDFFASNIGIEFPCISDNGSIEYNPLTGELRFDIGQMLWEEEQGDPNRYPRFPASRKRRSEWDGGSYGLPKGGLPFRDQAKDKGCSQGVGGGQQGPAGFGQPGSGFHGGGVMGRPVGQLGDEWNTFCVMVHP